MDVLYAHFTRAQQGAASTCSRRCCASRSRVIVIWLSLQYVQQSYVIGEQSSDPGGLTHRWVLKALIPVGFVLLLLQSVARSRRAG